ncbi:MAG: hypothetical protein BGP06_15270 [Rhizobiales bacterium 65-9]|nr:S1 family peptidase [Hyphomicrobiales bacterium]OJY37857.1 MAG: hypothetical protein BGP06_15270 [Rhizobiales bacterium 65-9]
MASRVAILLSAALAAAPAAALTGASPAADQDRSAVMILNEGGGFCTAVALDRRTLLTAGHCVAGGRAMRVHWREGGQPAFASPASATAHPEFSRDAVRTRRRSIDLGLVRLAEPLPQRFSPATLSAGAPPATGEAVTALGFGPTNRRDPSTAGTMRRAELSAIAPYGPSKILLWASSPSAGICPGDSGGPMLDAAGRVVAITAWGGTGGASGCAGPAQGVLVGPQRAWIDRILAGWGARARWEQ